MQFLVEGLLCLDAGFVLNDEFFVSAEFRLVLNVGVLESSGQILVFFLELTDQYLFAVVLLNQEQHLLL